MESKVLIGFTDELVKLSGVLADLGTVARHDPLALGSVAKETATGKGSALARGAFYGLSGYEGLKGLGYRDPETRKRDPLKGAARGVIKGALIGLPLGLLLRYSVLKKALRQAAQTPV